jgi:hypothetical protein
MHQLLIAGAFFDNKIKNCEVYNGSNNYYKNILNDDEISFLENEIKIGY